MRDDCKIPERADTGCNSVSNYVEHIDNGVSYEERTRNEDQTLR